MASLPTAVFDLFLDFSEKQQNVLSPLAEVKEYEKR